MLRSAFGSIMFRAAMITQPLEGRSLARLESTSENFLDAARAF